MEKYVQWLKNQGFRPNTIKRYLVVANQFQSWCEESGFELHHIGAAVILEWKQYLLNTKRNRKGEKLKITTVNNTIESLKPYFRYLEDTGVIARNPIRDSNIKVQKIQKRKDPRWLNRKEKTLFRSCIDEDRSKDKNPWRYARNRAIVYSMLFAGLRVSEVSGLKVEDIEGGYIKIRDGKGGKAREIYMNQSLKKIMREWLDQREKKADIYTDHVFVSQKGGPLTVSGIEKLFKTLSRKAGLNVSPHMLRHTFCHDLVENGFSLQRVADLAGHDSLDTTRLYVTSSDDEEKEALDSLL